MVYIAISILGICLTITNFIDKFFDYKKQKDKENKENNNGN